MSVLQALSDTNGAANRLAFSRASALTFEPTQQSPSVIRETARSLGFLRVVGVSRLSHIEEVLTDSDFEVLILDADAQRSEVFDLMRDIRHGRTAGNPFVTIVGTVYDISEREAGQMLSAGMDTVIVKPFSVESLYNRLATLVRARKRFVATPSYIGPDRRDERRSAGEAIPLLEVPNTLAYSVLNRMEDRVSLISRAKHSVVVQQVQRLGVEMQRRMEELDGCADLLAGRRGVAAELEASLESVALSVENDGDDDLAGMLGAARKAIEELAASCTETKAMAVVQTGGRLGRIDPPK